MKSVPKDWRAIVADLVVKHLESQEPVIVPWPYPVERPVIFSPDQVRKAVEHVLRDIYDGIITDLDLLAKK